MLDVEKFLKNEFFFFIGNQYEVNEREVTQTDTCTLSFVPNVILV